MKLKILAATAILTVNAHAKTFQNSYVSFEVPDNWSCLQEGVAWTCTPSSPIQSKEAVIVLASKVAGPEDNLGNFKAFLSQPKSIMTRVKTPMPSKVMYAQERMLAGTKWIQAQHLGSEIQEYYTLYLATVKEQLAILVSFSAEHDHYQAYNPVFDKAMKTLKIVASQQLLFPNKKVPTKPAASETIAIQPDVGPPMADLAPPPEPKRSSGGIGFTQILTVLVLIGVGIGYYLNKTRRKKESRPKSKSRPRSTPP